MDEDDINYKLLRQIQQQEKNSPLLTKIDINFYNKLTDYLKNLDNVIKKEENPQNIKLFKDEIKNTKKLVFSIYEFREKKIVQAALSKVRGGKPELKNLIEIERKVYESLVEQIKDLRKKILNINSKEEKTEKKQKIIENDDDKQNNNPIVRVFENIPEFVGTDMKTYSLNKDDVLSISRDMMMTLVRRNVVKQIK